MLRKSNSNILMLKHFFCLNHTINKKNVPNNSEFGQKVSKIGQLKSKCVFDKFHLN